MSSTADEVRKLRRQMRESGGRRQERTRKVHRKKRTKRKAKTKQNITPEVAAQKVMRYVHPYAATALFMIALVLGFNLGWFVMEQPDRTGVALLVCIILIWAAKFPIKMWHSWAASKDGDDKWLAEQIEKEMGAASESTAKGKASITEDDFDKATRSILMNSIKTARKQKTTVTVPFLLQELSKSIR